MQIVFAAMGYLALAMSIVCLGFTLWMAIELGFHWSVLIGLFLTYFLFGNGIQMIEWSQGKEDFEE